MKINKFYIDLAKSILDNSKLVKNDEEYDYIMKELKSFNYEVEDDYDDGSCYIHINNVDELCEDVEWDNLENALAALGYVITTISRNYNKELKEKAKKQLYKETLEIELDPKRGYKYIIDNQMVYYYLVKGDEDIIEEIDFKYIFDNSLSLGYVDDYYYKRIEKYLGKEAVKYFYYKFKTLQLEQIK